MEYLTDRKARMLRSQAASRPAIRLANAAGKHARSGAQRATHADTACLLRAFSLVDALGLDGEYVASLLDADDEGRSIDFERCSHTAMRVWQYTHGRPTGWHVDNGFITLAPRGTL